MSKEQILRHLQEEWNRCGWNGDAFKEHVCDYVDEHSDEGYVDGEDGETVAVVDWVLNNLEL